MLKNVFFAVFLTLAPTYALADSITFDALSEATVTTHTEGAFTYTQSLGTGWSLSSSFGNPVSGLLTKGREFLDFGSTIDIFLTGGGLFTFNSFQLACAGISDDIIGDPFEACEFEAQSVQFFGTVGGSTLFTSPFFTDPSFSLPLVFGTFPSGTALQFDRLQIRIGTIGTGRMVLDNINLTPIGAVAEPGTLLLLVSGLAGLTGMGFSRSRKK